MIQSYGQNRLLTIKLIDSNTKQSVSDANIIQKDNYIGKSDEKGFFTFQKKDSATISITHVVYESIKFSTTELLVDTLEIKLNSKNILLKEVEVSSEIDSLFSTADKKRIKSYAKKFTKLFIGHLEMAKIHEQKVIYVNDDVEAFWESNIFLISSTKKIGNSLLTAVPKSSTRFLINPIFKNLKFSEQLISHLVETYHYSELRRFLNYNPMLLKNLNNFTFKIVYEDENTIKIKYNFRIDKKIEPSKRFNGFLTINKKSSLLEEFSYRKEGSFRSSKNIPFQTIFFQSNNNSIYCSGGKSEYILRSKNDTINTRVKHVFEILSNYGPNTIIKDHYNIMFYRLKDFTNYDINEWKSLPIKNSIFLSDILTFNKNSNLEDEFKLGSQYLNELSKNLKGDFKLKQESLNILYPQIIKKIETKLKIEL